ncbi:hypothetical protein C2E23DRAFT_518262 [Lenzites betulinus]|nr:hypothetical protein C2E23DRAFT_518262 [Lenzites betulinus]
MYKIILAKETGRATTPRAHPPTPNQPHATYEAPVPPPTPIKKGMKVRIHKLELCDDLFPANDISDGHFYTTKPTNVFGTVLNIKTRRDGDVEIEIQDESTKSNGRRVVVTAQNRQGVTVELSIGRRIWDRITRKPLAESKVAFEKNATVFLDTTTPHEEE